MRTNNTETLRDRDPSFFKPYDLPFIVGVELLPSFYLPINDPLLEEKTTETIICEFSKTMIKKRTEPIFGVHIKEATQAVKLLFRKK
jgi:hypothetical protein